MEPRITDKRTIAERYGNKAIMEKKPQQSTKYKNVTQVVDTGKTIKDVQFISDQLVSKRKSEMFKRIKSSTIIKLLNQNKQTESIYNLGNEVENMPIDDSHSVVSSKTANTAMSQKTTVTAVTYATEMLGNLSEIDFILLDLREESNYKDYHIKEAFSFPGVQISRDKFLSQMIMMKNKESKMIIVYRNDERSGVPYAALLFQKGYDNIYFLSGGIEEFVKKYNKACNVFNVCIDEWNDEWSKINPDHKIDMDDENDIYNQFIHDKTENIVTKLNELYPGKVKLEVDGVCDFVGIADGEKMYFIFD